MAGDVILNCMSEPQARSKRWLITGVAGFIGSNLLESLLSEGYEVRGLDNFTTGSRSNLDQVRERVSPGAWSGFRLLEGDIRRTSDVMDAVAGAEVVIHLAAGVSAPQSLREPCLYHEINVSGFLNVLEACRKLGVSRLVYASSSAVYGDWVGQPVQEDSGGAPLTAYALSKRMNEDYAALYGRCYGTEAVGLRYFNVFGPRQDPEGPYSAVIPRWVRAWIRGEPIQIFGDGEATRDFCPVSVVVEANRRAATTPLSAGGRRVFNVGCGRATTLNRLAQVLQTAVGRRVPSALSNHPIHASERPGDIRHSLADISELKAWTGWTPNADLDALLDSCVDWFVNQMHAGGARGCPRS